MRPPARTEGLREGRLQLHWAAQALGALGASLRPAQADSSHTALDVQSGRLHVSGKGIDASLDGSGALSIARGGNARTLPLPGCTLDDVLGDIQQVLKMLAVRDPDPIARLEHDLPEHPIGSGEPFEAFPIESDVVLRWLAFGWERLTELGARHGLEPLRLWPHHFDAARLWKLGATQSGPAIGFGFSPGDDTYDEPYFYVNLWPYPDAEAHLPDLADGCWHREGWTGAVLLGARVLEGASVAAFFDDASAKGKAILTSS